MPRRFFEKKGKNKLDAAAERSKGFGGDDFKLSRFNEFVIVPKLLQFPTAHAGLPSVRKYIQQVELPQTIVQEPPDDWEELADMLLNAPVEAPVEATTIEVEETSFVFHDQLGLPAHDRELLELAQNTIKMLAKKKVNVCEKVLFLGLRAPDRSDYPMIPAELYAGSEIDIFNRTKYQGHFFSDYLPTFANENQKFKITLNIAAHGNLEGIGTNFRMPADLFAESIMSILHVNLDPNANVPRFLDEVFEINIVFHSCNAAYCDFPNNANEKTMRNRILTSSYIGQVATILAQNENFKGSVSGIRGFYTALQNGSGVLVTRSATPNPREVAIVDYEKTMFCIKINNKKLSVVFPEAKYRDFKVDIHPDNQHDTPRP